MRRTLLRLPTSDEMTQPYIVDDRIYPPTVGSHHDAWDRIVSRNRLVFRSSQDIDARLCRTLTSLGDIQGQYRHKLV